MVNSVFRCVFPDGEAQGGVVVWECAFTFEVSGSL